ncbi:hypothetical protein HNQ56_000086 [Anaerotaenia torta]
MRLFLIIWLAVMIMDNLLPFLLAKYYKGYDHKKMALSVLGCKQTLACCYLPLLFFAISEFLHPF